MTLEEAQKIASIASTADSGCSVCVGSLCDALQEAFPEFNWKYEEYEAIVVSNKQES